MTITLSAAFCVYFTPRAWLSGPLLATTRFHSISWRKTKWLVHEAAAQRARGRWKGMCEADSNTERRERKAKCKCTSGEERFWRTHREPASLHCRAPRGASLPLLSVTLSAYLRWPFLPPLFEPHGFSLTYIKALTHRSKFQLLLKH